MPGAGCPRSAASSSLRSFSRRCDSASCFSRSCTRSCKAAVSATAADLPVPPRPPAGSCPGVTRCSLPPPPGVPARHAAYSRCISLAASPGPMAASSASPGRVRTLPARSRSMLPSTRVDWRDSPDDLALARDAAGATAPQSRTAYRHGVPCPSTGPRRYAVHHRCRGTRSRLIGAG